ncbi:sulfite exporter TauE/SafE family protein [Chamaesiphon sp. VAR_48_metabat_135_sub]|uniref:sulfite exporter TauE/SafE family protein n=1 Tax=Chamaesiphon sp. VAR_48_metabat_135_sub TaxID=2964699 RepID=UPI00286C9AF0|nr:sulfite exporter TauE/SafE family protein [Chamaesiphon sp. VAR_48_metabat_135_sub]
MSLDLVLILGGLGSGLLAGILGIGGGSVLVPLMVYLGFTPINAIGTSSLAILLTSLSGSIQNWRMGYIDWSKISSLGLPALLAAQLGAALAQYIPASWLLFGFGTLMLTNIYLVSLKQRLIDVKSSQPATTRQKLLLSTVTGSLAGLVAGLVGVGGGAIMVPLQMLLLGETIKIAIQTSLGVVVLTAISATIGHSINGHVLFSQGLILGIGGLLGAQFGTRYLPKLPETVVSNLFRFTLFLISVYSFVQGIKIIDN